MTIHKTTVEISKQRFDKINKLLSMTGNEIYDKYGMKRDETITHTAEFDDGCFMDIKLVICDGEEKPYTEAVLYNSDGKEVDVSGPWDDYDGLWSIGHGDWSYEVEVVSRSI